MEPVATATPYDRARALSAQGLSAQEIRARLIADGVDAESAAVAAAAVAGRAPMHVDALGAEGLHVLSLVDERGVDVELRWDRGSFLDVAIDLIGGIACIGFGFALVIGWSQGRMWTPLMFGVLLIAVFRIRWAELAQSVLRLVIAATLVTLAFAVGDHAPLAGAGVSVGYGLYHAVRGWFAYRLFEHRRLGVPAPSPVPSQGDPAPAAAADPEPPVPSP
ncbi:MAG: hypothetical protein IRZ16_10935 [Myxococcaceae bacterium]|nr:hypothetical protein [Myxococcaceae bacterium]